MNKIYRALIVVTLIGFASCGETGGTIVVVNNSGARIGVSVCIHHDSEEHWESEAISIASGASGSIHVPENGWYRINGIRNVSVVNGETVTLYYQEDGTFIQK